MLSTSNCCERGVDTRDGGVVDVSRVEDLRLDGKERLIGQSQARSFEPK